MKMQDSITLQEKLSNLWLIFSSMMIMTSFGKLKASDVDNFTIYALKDEIIDGEEEISDELADKKKQDIHAKIYLRTIEICWSRKLRTCAE